MLLSLEIMWLWNVEQFDKGKKASNDGASIMRTRKNIFRFVISIWSALCTVLHTNMPHRYHFIIFKWNSTTKLIKFCRFCKTRSEWIGLVLIIPSDLFMRQKVWHRTKSLKCEFLNHTCMLNYDYNVQFMLCVRTGYFSK